jgi:hypothetical protein
MNRRTFEVGFVKRYGKVPAAAGMSAGRCQLRLP